MGYWPAQEIPKTTFELLHVFKVPKDVDYSVKLDPGKTNAWMSRLVVAKRAREDKTEEMGLPLTEWEVKWGLPERKI